MAGVQRRAQGSGVPAEPEEVTEARRGVAAAVELFRDVVEGTRDLVVQFGPDGAVRYINPAGEAFYGLSPARSLGRIGFDLIHPEDRERARRAFVHWIESGDLHGSIELRQIGMHGEERHLSWTVRLRYDDEGRFTHANCIARDITAYRETCAELEAHQARLGKLVDQRTAQLEVANQELEERIRDRVRAEAVAEAQRKRSESLLRAIPAGIILVDAETRIVVEANDAAARLAGRPIDQLVGHICHNFVCPADRNRCPVLDLGQRVDQSERQLVTPSGTTIPVLKTVVPLEMDGRKYLLESFVDIIVQKQAEAALREISSQDGLTGLANRRAFEQRMDEEWRRASRTGSPVTLLLCDVDHFKAYNDRHGHQQGDECLKRIAQALRARFVRADDYVARWGGEEFAVIIASCSAEQAGRAAEALRTAVEEAALPRTDDYGPVVTVSVGAASVVPEYDTEWAQLVPAADRAMYAAKSQGRNRSVVEAL